MNHWWNRSALAFAGILAACGPTTPKDGAFDAGNGGSGNGGGGGGGGGSDSGSGGGGLGGDSGSIGGGSAPHDASSGDSSSIVYGDGDVTVATTIYAHTDSTLYALDPTTNAVTLVGAFSGMGDASSNPITDLAVNAAGDVYVNTETTLYSAVLPATGGTGAVSLTEVAAIGAGQTDAGNERFYALAFAPAGLLGSGEMLVGGDGDGEVWSIDPTTGAIQDIGNFGVDPNNSANNLALSGDIVFYTDYTSGSSGTVYGLATIRSCEKGKSTCSKVSDYLAAIDITALQSNYTSHVTTASLLGGIYGSPVGADGGSTGTGSGIGYGEVFGLGAWGGSVYGFTRAFNADAGPMAPMLLTIDTSTGTATSGKGTLVAPPAGGYGFTEDGWSGAGVTTTVTIHVPPPPPPQPPQ